MCQIMENTHVRDLVLLITEMDLCFRRVPLAGHLGAYGVGAIAKAVASRYTYLGNLRIAKHVLATCKCDKEA